ncbi:MAG: hypothetical protein LBU46_06675 [Candidatus Accumulibacter sp.]|jgi:hypothetical protein|nr:hypothetical protein [Accumulibacter sp.]
MNPRQKQIAVASYPMRMARCLIFCGTLTKRWPGMGFAAVQEPMTARRQTRLGIRGVPSTFMSSPGVCRWRCGMPMDVLQKIFKPLRRIDFPGHGLLFFQKTDGTTTGKDDFPSSRRERENAASRGGASGAGGG